jgi:acylphosphatase
MSGHRPVTRDTVIRHVLVRGRVQGVGYRAWTELVALERGLGGWVRNRRDGAVEAVFAGDAMAVAAMLSACRRGPPAARVDGLQEQAAEASLLDLCRPGERFSVLPTS